MRQPFSGLKGYFNRLFFLLVTGLLFICARAGAQSFVLSVTSSVDSILVSNALTYTINVTNLTSFSNNGVVVISNALPASVQPLSYGATLGTWTNYGSVVVFTFGQFAYGGVAELELTVEPTAIGYITNQISATWLDVTNLAATNIVTLVTNTMYQSDLGVTMTGPAQSVITNDWMTYGMTVTNLGPGTVPNVVLTNALPAGVVLRRVFPLNQNYTVLNSNLIFNLGTLTNGAFKNITVTVQPTNAGILPFGTSVGAANLLDPDTTNNSAITNIVVTNYLAGTLVVFTNSAQTINFQNALTEQSITVSNAGLTTIPAVRVVVTGLTNQLFNAVGTNNVNPFVVYGKSLSAGQSVNLLLQFYPRGYFPFTNSQLHAYAVLAPNWTAPAATSVSTNINLSRIVKLADGNMLIEFPSTVGRTYTVVYSDDASFSNAMIAPPAIVAPANRTQWIDYGPPTTLSAPTNTPARFYRIFENP